MVLLTCKRFCRSTSMVSPTIAEDRKNPTQWRLWLPDMLATASWHQFTDSPYKTDEFEAALETTKGAVYTLAVSFNQPDDKHARFYNSEELLAASRQRMENAQAAFLERQATEQAGQSSLLRCIFGNPFRPTTVNPLWLTPVVVSVAQTIYDNRSFDQMLDLANTLEQAGCTDQCILYHCWQQGEHVRGCWVVDLLLGKK